LCTVPIVIETHFHPIQALRGGGRGPGGHRDRAFHSLSMAEPGKQRSWWLYAAGAAGAATAYCWATRRRTQADDTDFAGFLADPAAWTAAPPASGAPAPALDATGFDAFLREQPAAAPADPTGFDSFLRAAPSAPGGAQSKAAVAQQQQQEVPLDRAGVLIVFGTEYGFSKEIAEKLAASLKAGSAFWCAAGRCSCEELAEWRGGSFGGGGQGAPYAAVQSRRSSVASGDEEQERKEAAAHQAQYASGADLLSPRHARRPAPSPNQAARGQHGGPPPRL
jgi:hypothetical protein